MSLSGGFEISIHLQITGTIMEAFLMDQAGCQMKTSLEHTKALRIQVSFLQQPRYRKGVCDLARTFSMSSDALMGPAVQNRASSFLGNAYLRKMKLQRQQSA